MTTETPATLDQLLALDLSALLARARDLSWEIHGRRVQCYIPGRMVYMGDQGQYPTISLTGTSCELSCDHCNRRILEGMIAAHDPEKLREVCRKLDAEGNLGVLLSGGSDRSGALPWEAFLESIHWIKSHTRLKVSVHTGLIDPPTALALKDAGVDQALIDVIGAPETLQQVYHLPCGLDAMDASLQALAAAGLAMIPHVVVGLHYGRMLGEMAALDMIARYPVAALVIVVLNPMRGTPMQAALPPRPEDVARIVAAARLKMPSVPLSLSCTRPAGQHRRETDLLALEAGINRIAMPSEVAVEKARDMGLEVEFYKTCCSQQF